MLQRAVALVEGQMKVHVVTDCKWVIVEGGNLRDRFREGAGTDDWELIDTNVIPGRKRV